jgi:hypothetical protein
VEAGAGAIALGTVLFSDPFAPARVRSELAAEAASGANAPMVGERRRAGGSLPLPISSTE